MECVSCSPVRSESIADFISRHFGDRRLPIAGGIELTSRCNLRCIHCYGAPCRNDRTMTTNEVTRILDQVVDEGTLHVFFTGGEAMLRPDFEDIYIYARSKGLLVSVLSNATLITKRIVNVFLDCPVSLVSITMYGRTEDTYETVTAVRGSFKRFISGIELLKRNSIQFELKAVGMRQNLHEIMQIREFAKQLGVSFRYSFRLRPMNDGTPKPLDYRITADEAFWFDVNDEDRRTFWERVAFDTSEQRVGTRLKDKCLYLCHPSQQSFFISAEGILRPCTRQRLYGYDLLRGSFRDGWNHFALEFVNKKASDKFPCLTCSSFRYCEQCTADFELENGDPEVPIAFVCEIAHRRKVLIDSIRFKGLPAGIL